MLLLFPLLLLIKIFAVYVTACTPFIFHSYFYTVLPPVVSAVPTSVSVPLPATVYVRTPLWVTAVYIPLFPMLLFLLHLFYFPS